jgi:hypothetical protein
MRLLPRTPRRIWTLAALVGLAGVVAGWWLLPVVPRQTVKLPGPSVLLALTADGRTIVTTGIEERRAADGMTLTCGPFRFHDVDTGRELGTALTAADTFDMSKPSPDGRWLFVSACAENEYRPLLIDLISRAVVPLPGAGERKPGFAGTAEFSANGGLLAYGGWSAGNMRILLWELVAGRARGALSGSPYTMALSADGRWAAGVTAAEGKPAITVFATDTLAPRATVLTRTDETVQRLRLTDDGAYVVAAMTNNEQQRQLMSVSFAWHYVTVRAWDVATGQEGSAVRSVYGSFAVGPDGRTIITEHLGGAAHHCTWTDPATGWLRDGPPVGVEGAPSPSYELLSPDRRRLAVTRQVSSAGPLEQLARRLNVTWPFPTSGSRVETRVYDAATGGHVGDIPGDVNRWAADGRTLADIDWPGGRNRVRLWDVPPRKPLPAFAAGAAVWGLLVVALARWRTRRGIRPT